MEIERETRFLGKVIKRELVEIGKKFIFMELDPIENKHLMRYTLTVRPDGMGTVGELVNPDVVITTVVLKDKDHIEGFGMPSKIPGVSYSFKCIED